MAGSYPHHRPTAVHGSPLDPEAIGRPNQTGHRGPPSSDASAVRPHCNIRLISSSGSLQCPQARPAVDAPQRRADRRRDRCLEGALCRVQAALDCGPDRRSGRSVPLRCGHSQAPARAGEQTAQQARHIGGCDQPQDAAKYCRGAFCQSATQRPSVSMDQRSAPQPLHRAAGPCGPFRRHGGQHLHDGRSGELAETTGNRVSSATRRTLDSPRAGHGTPVPRGRSQREALLALAQGIPPWQRGRAIRP